MLVLTRSEGDSILIGEAIRITVIRLSEGKVRLGLEAPRGVTILRSELASPEDLEALDRRYRAGGALGKDR